MSVVISDLLTDALCEIRAARAGDVPPADDMAFSLGRLNALLDEWNADQRTVYHTPYVEYTLTPSLDPHTIGPGGTFNVTQRPVSIDAVALILTTSTPSVYLPLTPRDEAWLQNRTIPALATAYPTDYVYFSAWPLGEIHFWPVPTTAWGVRVWTRVLLAQVALTDTFTLPPGYQSALTLTLAERLATPFGQQLPQMTQLLAAQARARVFAANDDPVRIGTRDSGMPGGGPETFNWRSRSFG